MDEQRIERALREGPQFGTLYVARPLALDQPLARPATSFGRLVLILAVAAVLLMLMFTALAVGGFFERASEEPTLIFERAEITAGSGVSHEAVTWGDQPELPALDNLPSQAVQLRWSRDGEWLTYYLRGESDGFLSNNALVLARGDGSSALPVRLPREFWRYTEGVTWAPSSARFAFPWTCQESTCEVTGGIDVFDTSGELVTTVVTGAVNTPGWPMWSPDSERIGWPRSYCIDEPDASYCLNDAFQHRSVLGSDQVVTLELGPWTEMEWSTTNRLLVREWGPRFGWIAAAYSLALDGSDRRDVSLVPGGHYRLQWSSDGSRLAGLPQNGRQLTIIDVATGEDTYLNLPASAPGWAFVPESWSPDNQRLVYLGGPPVEGSSGDHYYVINVDGSGWQSLGIGHDLTWVTRP
jgi:Tol biopolymer transport system component